MDDTTLPGEPRPTGTPLVRGLTIVASALTAASIAVNVALQIAHHLEKRPLEPDQRDRVQTAQVALKVVRQVPGLVKHVRLVMNQLKGSA